MGGGGGGRWEEKGCCVPVRKCLSLVLKVLYLQFDVGTSEICYRDRAKARRALAWGHRHQGVSLQLCTPPAPQASLPMRAPCPWLLESIHSKPGARG